MSDYPRANIENQIREPTERVAKMSAVLLHSFSLGLERRSYPRVADLRDEEGNQLPVQITPKGTITHIDESGGDQPILQVSTDSGAVVSGVRELLTHELTGCLAVFIFGRKKSGEAVSGLIHLTPTSQLSWGNYRWKKDDLSWGSERRGHAAGLIANALSELDADPASTSLYIIGNRGSESDDLLPDYGYSETELDRKRKQLAAFIGQHGYAATIFEPLPYATCSLFWTPEQPDQILVVGESTGDDNPHASVIPLSNA